MTDAKFIKRKRPNYKRAIILVIILIIILVIFYNVEALFTGLFEVKE